MNDAILFLAYAQQLGREGRSAVEALFEATPARLRPIILSNAAIAIALLPRALGSGPGSFSCTPMAVAAMGGVLSSAVVTLLLNPVLFGKIDRSGAAVRRGVVRLEMGECEVAQEHEDSPSAGGGRQRALTLRATADTSGRRVWSACQTSRRRDRHRLAEEGGGATLHDAESRLWAARGSPFTTSTPIRAGGCS